MPEASRAVRQPTERLRPLIHRYSGYRYSGLTPGVHRGLPSPYLTIVISLGPDTRVSVSPDLQQQPEDFGALAAGLDTRSSLIFYDQTMYGVQLDLTPAGARSLLGIPAGELRRVVVPLENVLQSEAHQLTDRMACAPDWPSRFAILDDALSRRMGRLVPAEAPLAHAWDLITRSAGDIRISQVAAEVGWSRRQLAERFSHEYGLTPKEVSRVARFHRSRQLIQHHPDLSIATVAARSGYCDQSHLAREWREFSGCPPSTWLVAEDLPFIQDTRHDQDLI